MKPGERESVWGWILHERVRIDGALRELSYNPKSQDWIPASKNMSGPNRKKAVILPYEKVRSWRGPPVKVGGIGGIGGITDMGHATDATVATHLYEDLGGHVTVVRTVIRELCDDGHSAFLEDVHRLANERGTGPLLADRILKRLRTEGDLWEPTPGTYRLAEASP